APEQAMNSRTVDVRADLYSLGCTLFYLLTGQQLFTGGELTEILLKHQIDEPPTLAERGVDAPEQVQAILDRRLAKTPDDRYQTPADLVQAITPFCREGTLAENVISSTRRADPTDEGDWSALTLDDKPDRGRTVRRQRTAELSRASAERRAQHILLF